MQSLAVHCGLLISAFRGKQTLALSRQAGSQVAWPGRNVFRGVHLLGQWPICSVTPIFRIGPYTT